MKCPHCCTNLKDTGVTVEAINHYRYDDTQSLFIVEDCSLLPHNDSKITCSNCNEELNIQLTDLDADFVI